MSKDVLIVDDEAAIREVVGAVLEDEGYRPRGAANSDEALREIERRPPGLVLLDIWLEGSALDGVQILERVKALHPEMPVIMFSGHGTIETAVAAIKKGAYDFIEKPFKSDRLLHAIQRAIEASALRREVMELRHLAFDETEMIGNAPAMIRVRQAIERVAPTGSRIMISGPPGSGKDVAARLIHAKSRRANGPFVVLNASALAPERVDIELFGAEPGWQGAEQPRIIGLLERADGGTLLIDQVADMPLESQGKILRVLQEQRFSRLGSDARIEVDVRVIASTNRDLKNEMASGKFREDLYYRLNVVPSGDAAPGRAPDRHPRARPPLHGGRGAPFRSGTAPDQRRCHGGAADHGLGRRCPPAAQLGGVDADHGAGRTRQPGHHGGPAARTDQRCDLRHGPQRQR